VTGVGPEGTADSEPAAAGTRVHGTSGGRMEPARAALERAAEEPEAAEPAVQASAWWGSGGNGRDPRGRKRWRARVGGGQKRSRGGGSHSGRPVLARQSGWPRAAWRGRSRKSAICRRSSDFTNDVQPFMLSTATATASRDRRRLDHASGGYNLPRLLDPRGLTSSCAPTGQPQALRGRVAVIKARIRRAARHPESCRLRS